MLGQIVWPSSHSSFLYFRVRRSTATSWSHKHCFPRGWACGYLATFNLRVSEFTSVYKKWRGGWRGAESDLLERRGATWLQSRVITGKSLQICQLPPWDIRHQLEGCCSPAWLVSSCLWAHSLMMTQPEGTINTIGPVTNCKTSRNTWGSISVKQTRVHVEIIVSFSFFTHGRDEGSRLQMNS